MDSERWKIVQAAFERAAALPPEDLGPHLLRLREQDPDLAREVERLVRADAETRVLLDGQAWEWLDEEAAGDAGSEERGGGAGSRVGAATGAASREGERIGPYVLGTLIGRGGMGAVYMADRVEGDFEQRVALKLIRSGADSADVEARFRAERQILARLDHPNIARLLDGGITAEGEPWFALEYVDGRSITAYCDEEGLTPEQRLELFRTVCSAVQYAHANLVIHRDLKPNNILVTVDGTPKLLDFGIAKLLDPDEDDPAGVHTRTGVRVLTPRYASPEQLSGDRITTASDIYALGILLYRLLTGQDPHEPDTASSATLEREIRETAPSRPSDAVTGEAASVQGVSLDRLRQRLRGDLDAIVLKALRKEPVRRYPSVPEFSEDVQRYLTGLPVSAGPDEWSYRARKFVARHTAGVTAAAGVVLLLAGFGVAMSLQASRIAQERDIASQERAKAEQVTEFLVDVFQANDPNEAQGVEMTAGQILSRGREKVRQELAEEPEAQAAVLDAMGRVYRSLAEYDSAEVILEAAREIRERELGPEHPDYATSVLRLGELARVRGDLDRAVALNLEALELRRAHFGPQSLEVAHSLSNLGVAMGELEDQVAADSLYRQSLEIRQALLPPDDPIVATSLNNLAGVYMDLAQYDSAVAMYERVLDIRLDKLGEDHLETAIALNNLATTHELAGRYDEAEPLYVRSIEIRKRLLDDDHPDVLRVVSNLGALMLRSGRAAEAVPLFEEVIAIRRQNPQEVFALGVPLNNIGQAHVRLERYDEATAAFQEAYELFVSELGPEHGTVSFPLSGMAVALSAQGEYEQAAGALEEVLRIRTAAYGESHPRVAFTMDELGSLYVEWGRLDQAEPLLVDALALRREVLDPDHPETANSLDGLAQLRMAQARPEEAEPLFREALEIRLAKLDGNSIEIATSRAALGRCLTQLGQLDEAETLLTEAYTAIDASLGPEAATSRRTAGYLRDLYEQRGDLENAARFGALSDG